MLSNFTHTTATADLEPTVMLQQMWLAFCTGTDFIDIGLNAVSSMTGLGLGLVLWLGICFFWVSYPCR